MKNTKKFASLLLALIMIFALATGVYAEGETGSITINDAVVGQTYTVYQILDLESYNTTANAYAYKATTAWNTFINSDAIKGTYVEVDAQGYVTWKTGADAAAFAKAAQKYAKDNKIANQGTSTAATTTVSFTGLDLGYYLVDTTLGTLCSLDTTNPTVTIKEKNQVPVNEKTVEEDSKVGKEGVDAWGATNDADIGQTVNFKSTITAQAGAENYVFHDIMSAGLTLDKASIKVDGVNVTNADGTDKSADNYTVSYPSGEGSDGCTFEIAFAQSYLDTITQATTITITYSATLNENAVIAGEGNPNTSKVSYGDSSNTKYTPDSQTKTYTWDVDVFKYTMSNNTETALAGATFTLSKNSDGTKPIALVSEGNNVYRVAKTGETGTVTEITTDSTGKFTIKGLDADTYYLTETAAPAGYNKLAAPIKVMIDNNGNVTYATKTTANGEYGNAVAADASLGIKVLNQSGALLPSTGGIGTTIFYVVGSILVVGAVVLLVTKKRMSMKG